MSNQVAQVLGPAKDSIEAISAIVLRGDLKSLDESQRAIYMKMVCERLGIDYLTRPFDFIVLNGKLVMYANRGATDQIRKVNKVSVNIVSRDKIEDLLVVTARGRDAFGREDESVGAVNVAGLKGEALANAMMKCETKAKRRVTLSLCGLGILDESEVADIPEAAKANVRPDAYGGPVEGVDGVFDNTYRIDFAPWTKVTVADAVARDGIDKLLDTADKFEGMLAGKIATKRDLKDPVRRAKLEEFIREVRSYARVLDGKQTQGEEDAEV